MYIYSSPWRETKVLGKNTLSTYVNEPLVYIASASYTKLLIFFLFTKLQFQMEDLTKLTLDELLRARVNATTVEQYTAVNNEISRRYNKYVIKRIDLNVEF